MPYMNARPPLVFKDPVPFSNAPKVQFRVDDGKYTYGTIKTG